MVRQFRVSGTYWSGSEYVSCETTKEFVDYWSVRNSDDLNSHIWRSNFDFNSPALKPDEIRHPEFDETNYEWFDYNDLEHITEFDFDGRLEVVEIDDSGNPFGDLVIVNPHILYTRNGMFHQVSSGDDLDYWVEDKLEKYIPVFSLTHFEKGSFGQWVIETGPDGFDPSHFVVGLFQHHDGTKVERFFYQGEELDYSCDFDGGWNSKGSISRVGWSWNNFSQYYNLRNTNIDLGSPAMLEYDFVRDDWNRLLQVV